MHEIMDFYKGKKIFITGDTGFKGSWLAFILYLFNSEVIGFALEPPTIPSLFEVLHLNAKIKHITGDIRNFKFLKSILKEIRPEIVFHLSAQSLVGESYKDPVYTYETNLMGTLYLLEAIRECGSVKSVIIITSDKCYNNKEWFYGYREIDELGGYDPYSSSKACVEIMVKSYRDSFFNLKEFGTQHHTAIATARAGNVIGGGDWQKDRLVPDCIKALVEKKPIKLRNPEGIRPWQHVFEPLYGYLLLAVKLQKDPLNFSTAWNFGPFEQNTAKVKDIVEKIVKLWGEGTYKIIQEKSYHETGILRLDISNSLFKLGWKPKWDLDTALNHTVKWYKTFYTSPEKIIELSIAQIREYFSIF